MMAHVGYRNNQVRANVITRTTTTATSNQMIPTKNKEITIKSEDLPVGLSRRIETPLRSSPDSSTADDYSVMGIGPNGASATTSACPLRCPHCPILCSDESSLSDHLLRVHRVRLIKAETTATTRCPVCRQLVTDLSHHFAMEHSEKKGNNHLNNNNSYNEEKIVLTNGAVTSSSNGNGAFLQMSDSAKVIPIFLPNHPVPESQLSNGRKMSNGSIGDDPVSPMNLSVRRSSDPDARSNHVTLHVNNDYSYDDHVTSHNNNNNNNNSILPTSYAASRSAEDSEDFEESASNFSGEYPTAAAAAEARKRRKQTHVPVESKDDKYWARRMKNNEAAKRSRDMRIKREKVVFEENSRLEQDNREMRTELDRVITENKELHLKMGLILDENARLKSIIYSMQQQQQQNGERNNEDDQL